LRQTKQKYLGGEVWGKQRQNKTKRKILTEELDSTSHISCEKERKKERRPANKLNHVDHASLEEGERDTHEKLVDYYYRHRVL
jgi:hypothetical protein